jgi:hypothetical protein
VSGLSTAVGAAEVTDAFRISMVVAAFIAAAASPLALLGLRSHVRCERSARRVYCSVDGPPLQPDPERCPALAH